MKAPILSVREIEERDIELIANYWLTSSDAHLLSMGVDVNKMPSRIEFVEMLTYQLTQPYELKKSYCIIWLLNANAVGHCNVNSIEFGEKAYMHLHMWESTTRKKGLGSALLKLSIPYFFKHLQLKKICCEPYAGNPAPNKTLPTLGFKFIKEYITFPGSFSFEQPTKLWELNKDTFAEKE
jgi:RimJ/RimL family protein N-acetyltransferase